MASTTLTSLSSDRDYYTKVYALLCERCKFAEKEKNWADNDFPLIVIDRLRHIPEGETLRSIGIGSGTGDMECLMLQQLSSRFPTIQHTVVEPGKEFVEQYKSQISTTESNMKGVTFDFHVQTMQDFLKTLSDNKRFHFISILHALYFADDLTHAIQSLEGMLEEGGVLLMAVTNDASSHSKLDSRFVEVPAHNTNHKFYTSADVTKCLKELELPFAVYIEPCATDITPIFDASSAEGNFLLDFVTHTLNFRSTAPAKLACKVLEYLKSDECCPSGDGDSVIYNNTWNYFIVQKPLACPGAI